MWKSCEALLFDKDGTLLDFKKMWLGWCEVTLEELHSEHPRHSFGECLDGAWGVCLKKGEVDPQGYLSIGSMNDLSESLSSSVAQEGISPEKAESSVARALKAAYQAVEEKNLVQPLPGIPQALKKLHEQGFKMAIVTTDDSEKALENLQCLGLSDYFEAVLGCDLVAACKPAPDLVLEACRLLKTRPEKVAVIGDTVADMKMGKAAGAKLSLGVTSGVTPKKILLEVADMVLGSVAEMAD